MIYTYVATIKRCSSFSLSLPIALHFVHFGLQGTAAVKCWLHDISLLLLAASVQQPSFRRFCLNQHALNVIISGHGLRELYYWLIT